MDTAKQFWEILQKVPTDLINRVREFMVIGNRGEGVLLVTEDGEGYWLGKMRLGNKMKQTKKLARLNVPRLASMTNGDDHILLLDEEGHIHAMGRNKWGQLGLGTVDKETCFSPQLISNPHKFTSVRCGLWHSLALTEDGKVWAWGNNNWGQVGVPTSSADHHSTLQQICELNSYCVIAIECGGAHSLALTDQGEVYAWGWNEFGQLGLENGDMDKLVSQLHIPTRIPTPSPIKSIAAGGSHTLLLTQTGEVYACGRNQSGQLGIPTTTESWASLVKVAGLPVISHIASHFFTNQSIAITAKQECFVWGDLSNTSTPFQLPQIYSTLDSAHSYRSSQRNTPHSVRVKDEKYHINSTKQTELQSGPTRLEDRASRMFFNPESNLSVKLELEDQTSLAYRSGPQISSANLNQLFSESSNLINLNPATTFAQGVQNLSPLPHATNPSESDSQNSPISPHSSTPYITIPIILGHAYPTFHAYLCFLNSCTLQVLVEQLTQLFELARSYLHCKK